MKIKHIIFLIVLIIGIPIIFLFYSLNMSRYFSPKFQRVQREVFEETKSYTHGVIQDLAKYYDEYSKSSLEEQKVIASIIKIRFAEFDSNKIKSYKLKKFLEEKRGY